MLLTGLIIVASLFVLVGLLEVYARVVLGLGNPPLWMADPEIEYLPQPAKSYLRFGNRISYNAYSMRSRDFPRNKVNPAELRVLVVGDSIINGGAHTDQQALATTLLEHKLAESLDRPVMVANIAAGSWGPPNILAYLRRFGLFDADVVVIVLNSPDYADAPTFQPLGPRRPQRKPVLALQELHGKYVPRYFKKNRGLRRKRQPPTPEAIDTCLSALRELIRMTRQAGASVLLAQYLKRSEVATMPEIGHRKIAQVAQEAGIEPIQLGPEFSKALRDGPDPYLADIHPNEHGQRIIAEVLFDPIREAAS